MHFNVYQQTLLSLKNWYLNILQAVKHVLAGINMEDLRTESLPPIQLCSYIRIFK